MNERTWYSNSNKCQAVAKVAMIQLVASQMKDFDLISLHGEGNFKLTSFWYFWLKLLPERNPLNCKFSSGVHMLGFSAFTRCMRASLHVECNLLPGGNWPFALSCLFNASSGTCSYACVSLFGNDKLSMYCEFKKFASI